MSGIQAHTSGMRKIIAYIAVSADGYIALPDGGVDWLSNRPSPPGNYGMASFFKTVDTILWGRKTLDQAVEKGWLAGFGPKIKNYGFSRKPQKKPVPGIEYITEPIPTFAKRLRNQPGKNIWMMGGGGILASFLDFCEIDELSIHVIPTFIGDGVRLIEPGRRSVDLKLLSTKRFADGVVHLNYSVICKKLPSRDRKGA
jgi:dihydrofolate reductase